ncbi:hypothetical protein [Nocardia tengchongensis]|uniref:hypothetical protein n=1 Tax=Nocardia tengchongensis TaxID=2055889 RepID=UPI00369AB748
MKSRSGVEQRFVLGVTVDFTDPAHRSLRVRWTADAAASPRFESARIFLVALRSPSARTYLGLVDGLDRASVELPPTLAAGAYAIEIDAYGGASWGDGRLDARGRSAEFTVEAAEQSTGSGDQRSDGPEKSTGPSRSATCINGPA